MLTRWNLSDPVQILMTYMDELDEIAVTNYAKRNGQRGNGFYKVSWSEICLLHFDRKIR